MPDGFRVTGTELGDWWQWFLRQQWQPQGLVYRNGRYVLEDGRMATQPLSQALRGAPQPPPTPESIRTELTEKYGGAGRIPLSDLTDEQAEYLREIARKEAELFDLEKGLGRSHWQVRKLVAEIERLRRAVA